ncbi:MAG: hypothetical protein Q7R40_10705 [Phaeospirillum sp.]|nr:hypothetical protein [Phaeospirillum sp.]
MLRPISRLCGAGSESFKHLRLSLLLLVLYAFSVNDLLLSLITKIIGKFSDFVQWPLRAIDRHLLRMGSGGRILAMVLPFKLTARIIDSLGWRIRGPIWALQRYLRSSRVQEHIGEKICLIAEKSPALIRRFRHAVFALWTRRGQLQKLETAARAEVEGGDANALVDLARLAFKWGRTQDTAAFLTESFGQIGALSTTSKLDLANLCLELMMVRGALAAEPRPGHISSLEQLDRFLSGLDLSGMVLALCDFVLTREDSSLAWAIKGKCLHHVGRDVEAVEALTHACQQTQGSVVNAAILAKALEQLGRFQEAADALRTALARFPGEARQEDYFQVACLEVRRGAVGAAIEELTERIAALDIRPIA